MLLKKTHEYIKTSWKKAEVKIDMDQENPYWLPYSFVPPSVTGTFRVLFYWDTFFTNRGLISDGFFTLAKNNVDDLLYMVKKCGFVPNSWSRVGTKWCSQPPYLHFMVRDIYEHTKDKEWLKNAYFLLKEEYGFWMRERMTEIGLNRHYHLSLSEEDLVFYYDYVANNRLEIPTELQKEEKIRKAHHYVTAAESGYDWSPRFRAFAADTIPVDLNANLYGLESDLAEWSVLFEPEQTAKYLQAMQRRKQLMDAYCLGNDGLYHDYNYKTKELNVFYNAAQFLPFVVGLLSGEDALKRLLEKLEYLHGITSTEEDKEETHISYQWSYPNAWAPDNYLCVWALKKNGLEEDAKRVALKYMRNVAVTYEETGILWEKYDGVTGGRAKKLEHGHISEMLGWSGGVFSWLYNQYASEEE